MSASLFVENENNGESVSSGASISEKCIICWRNFAHCNSDGYLATGKIGNSTQIYFIFKHIFQLTQEQLESFLITGTDPDSWAKICETCSKNYVQDCWRLWIQLCDAQREFEGSRLKLIEAIKSAECRPIRIREKQGNLDISVETRRFVLKNEYLSQPGENPFIAGDKSAREKLEEYSSRLQSSVEEEQNVTTFNQLDNANINEKSKEDGQNLGDVSDSSDWNDDPLHDSCNDSDYEACPPPPPVAKQKQKQKPRVRKRRKKESKNSSEKEEKIQCEHCPKLFGTKKNFERHMRGKHKLNPLCCPKCDYKSFAHTESTLDEHIKRYHGTEKDLEDFTCKHCNLVLSCRGALVTHISSLHDKEPLRYFCELCGAKSTTKQGYSRHMASIHGVEQYLRYSCPVEGCEKKFFKKFDFKIHQDTHKEEAPYKCNICGKTMGNRMSFQHHEKDHKTAKTILCSLCPKAYGRVEHLKRHMKSKHPEPDEKEKL